MVYYGKQEIGPLDIRPRLRRKVTMAKNGIPTGLLAVNAERTEDQEERIRGAVEAAAVYVERV